jgi:hypothetical protein
MVVNFQKNDEVEISFDITNFQEDELYFEQKFAKYKLNLRKLTAIETNNGEKLVYKCSLKSFKM